MSLDCRSTGHSGVSVPSVSFSVDPGAYDDYMGRYSLLLAPQLADFATVSTGQRLLDVGCGPGALTAELVKRVGAAAVSAVDPSEPFVAAVEERHPGVDVRRAAAEQLPFQDAEFDATLAQLVVHAHGEPHGRSSRDDACNAEARCRGGVGLGLRRRPRPGQHALGCSAVASSTPTSSTSRTSPAFAKAIFAELFDAAGLEEIEERDSLDPHPAFELRRMVGAAHVRRWACRKLRRRTRSRATSRTPGALSREPSYRTVSADSARLGSARSRLAARWSSSPVFENVARAAGLPGTFSPSIAYAGSYS